MSIHTNPYGVGLAYRYVLQRGILKYKDSIDLLEIPTEDYVVRRRRLNTDPDEELLREVLAEIPGTAHGISLSIGSVEPLDRNYLEGTRRLMQRHDLNVFSEHLAFHRMDGNDLSIFLAMPFEEEAVQWITANYNAVREALGRPFALENVTYYFPAPKSSLAEAEFLTRITEECDCTLLLDVTNVFNNAHNHEYDPIEFLENLPLDRVSQLHLAGGELRDGKWEDCHNSPVMEPVWDLFEEVLQRCGVGTVILERDSRFEPFDAVMEDIFRAREIFYRHRPAEPEEAREKIPIPDWQWEDAALSHWKDEHFARLRGYERAVMKRITTDEFRRRFADNAKEALDEFGLPAEWIERVELCSPEHMENLARGWDAMKHEAEREEQAHQNREWSAWAQILKQEEEATARKTG